MNNKIDNLTDYIDRNINSLTNSVNKNIEELKTWVENSVGVDFEDPIKIVGHTHGYKTQFNHYKPNENYYGYAKNAGLVCINSVYLRGGHSKDSYYYHNSYNAIIGNRTYYVDSNSSCDTFTVIRKNEYFAIKVGYAHIMYFK